MKSKILNLSGLALALGLSTSGCSWIHGMFSSNDETNGAKVTQADPVPSDSPSAEPMRVAADHDHHVQDASGKTVTSGYGDCVNIGSSVDSGKHPADCDKQGLKPATDTASGAAAPAADSVAKEEMAKPAAEPTTPAPLSQSGGGAPGIVQESDAGNATAQVQPVEERPTVAPSYEKISLQGDALFRFGKSDQGSILPAGIKKLDQLASQLAAYDRSSIESITVVGHADRLGKKAANQALSERRAQTVKNYFVKNGVDGAVIKSTGKGSNQSVKQCKGKKKTPQLVACLEPNRRVEVVIRGIKGS